MDFKQYPSYKDSGVEWLGEVPEHWDLKRFKYILEEINERSELGDETLLSVSEYYGVKPRKETIDEGDILSRAESLSGYKKCKSGDLVMNIMLAWKRGLGVTKFDGIVSPAYAVFRLFSHNYSEDYIHYLLRTETYTNYFKSFSTGIMDSRLRLYPEYFGNLTNISPSLKEQIQIVAFLDSETSRIDNLIAKQEKLIEKLEEHRKSVISHAVTKGLDPNAKMKDSGVKWLGEVPEHWSVSKLRYYLDGIKDGTHGSHISVEHGKLLLSGKNIKNGKLVINENERRIRLDDHEKITANGFPKKDDLLISVVGTIGQSCIYELEEPISFQRSVCFLRPNAKLKAIFLQKLLESNLVQNQLIMLTNKATVGGVYMGDLVELIIPIIPVDEQSQIANFLDSESSRINILITKQKELIEKLKEYRTSIISHAVTGKIDVRDLVA